MGSRTCNMKPGEKVARLHKPRIEEVDHYAVDGLIYVEVCDYEDCNKVLSAYVKDEFGRPQTLDDVTLVKLKTNHPMSRGRAHLRIIK